MPCLARNVNMNARHQFGEVTIALKPFCGGPMQYSAYRLSARKGRLVAEKPSDVAAETGVPGQTLWSTNEVKGRLNGEWTLAATGPADD